VYGQEVMVPLDFLVPSLRVATITNMTERDAVKERLSQLMIMEEDRILAGFHQEVQKARDKAWHDRHIKRKKFKEGYLVLVYNNKSLQHPGKLRMHWLGQYEVNTVIDGGDVQLKNLGGKKLRGMINGSQMKLYKNNRPKKCNNRGVTVPDIKYSTRVTVRRKDNFHVHSEMLAQWRKDQWSLKGRNNGNGRYDK
jgi:hypothetical protein